MNLLESALSYAAKGWPVFPVHYPESKLLCSCGLRADPLATKNIHRVGKHPMVEGGAKDASTSPIKIKEWWARWPKANIGIATGRISGLIVLDVDLRNGGPTSLAFLEVRWGKLPQTLTARSGGNGMHYYFRAPSFEVRGRIGMMAGLDVKADGGDIIAPPSSHASGKSYSWIIETEPVEIPRWLIRMIMQKQSNGKVWGKHRDYL